MVLFKVKTWTGFVFLAISLFCFAIYLKGVSPTSFGGDSGDIILSYYFGGVAHPPGYPLNTMLGYILSRLFNFGDFAKSANAVSAIYHAFAVGLFFLLSKKLTGNTFISISASLTLAFCPLFWLYAHSAEVFQLSAVLVLLSFIFLFSWHKNKSSKLRDLYLGLIFFSLGIFHHNTTVLLAPAIFYLIYKNRKRLVFANYLKAAGAMFFGLIPYSFVFWAASRHTPVNWDNPVNLPNFIRLISRADYGTFTAASGLTGFSALARAIQVLWYFKVLRADFTIFGIFLSLLGFFYLFLKKRDVFWFVFLAFFFSGPFFLFYASFPLSGTFLQGVSERFVLLSYLPFGLACAFGLVAVLEILAPQISRIYKNVEMVKILISSVFFLIPFTFFLLNNAKADLSGYKIGDLVGMDILNSASSNSIIFLQGDTTVFNTQYSYYIDKVNPNSAIVLTGRLRHASYRQELVRKYQDLAYPDVFLASSQADLAKIVPTFIAQNQEGREIYSIEELPLGSDWVWVQEGLLLHLYKKDKVPSNKTIGDNTSNSFSKVVFSKEALSGQYMQFFAENMVDFYASGYQKSAFELLKRSDAKSAKDYFQKALDLKPDFVDALFGLGITYKELGDCELSKEFFLQATGVDGEYWQAYEGLGQVYKDCFFDNAKSEQYLKQAKEIRDKKFSNPIFK